jgi:RNA polymerase sigma-70 factor (ECF subfamily)
VIPLASGPEAADPGPEPADEDPDRHPERQAMRAEMRRLMEARIDRLPESFRAVFVLRAVEELSVEEVAAALELPPATVRTRYFRARSLLREALAHEMDLAERDLYEFGGVHCDRVVAGVLARIGVENAGVGSET